MAEVIWLETCDVWGRAGSLDSFWGVLEARSSNGLGAHWTSLLGVALLLGCWTGLESAHAVPLVQLYHVVSAEVLWCAKTHPGRGCSGLRKKGCARRVSRDWPSSSQHVSTSLLRERDGVTDLVNWSMARFWQAGLNFQGLLDAVQKAVCPILPVICWLLHHTEIEEALQWSLLSMHACTSYTTAALMKEILGYRSCTELPLFPVRAHRRWCYRLRKFLK